MKNAPTLSTHTPLKLSDLEFKVCKFIEKYGEIHVYRIAYSLFGAGPTKQRKSASNSVTSAIRQINRKLEKANSTWRIVGKANGRGGKLVHIEHG